jgi:LCP family protein required for cell wall assembly
MPMIEELMRETFARHEDLAPAAEPVRRRIDTVATRRRRWRRGAAGCAAVVLVALVTTVFMRFDAMRTAPHVGATALASAADPAAGKPLTYLLVGTDKRPWDVDDRNNLYRSDSIMLVHLPADRSAPYVISIPRDHFVTVPGHSDKINAVYALGGPVALRDVVQELTGIVVNGVVEVDFAGLIAVTDAVGGVELCVPRRVVSDHTGRRFEPGCRHFTGTEAMDYLRQRKGFENGDFDRQKHAREYMKALYARLGDADLTQIVAVTRAAGGALRMDLGTFQLAGLLAVAKNVKPDQLVSIAPPATMDGQLLPEAAALWAAVRDGTLPAWVAANPQRVDQR